MTNTTEVETTEINKTKKKDIFMVDPRSIIFNAEKTHASSTELLPKRKNCVNPSAPTAWKSPSRL